MCTCPPHKLYLIPPCQGATPPLVPVSLSLPVHLFAGHTVGTTLRQHVSLNKHLSCFFSHKGILVVLALLIKAIFWE
jgi:hypothetical protein